ncbi:MAG: FAD-dependent oxidoreductase [Candidatus Obscuribacterales bacterium]|nr:FAD-dependent oxidoreductase [Candidatus Obscuribacterales bacterium]
MKSIAIVGSGIAGLGLAYKLRDHFDVTVYEKDNRLGGHSHTVEAIEDGKAVPFDTGFMVFNHHTYPLLLQLFEELNVPTKKTDMSFSVQHKEMGLEYSGVSFNRLFGDRGNLVNLRFWRMLSEIQRFNDRGALAVDNPELLSMSLFDYIRAEGYSTDFVDCYLIPMSGAIWSTPPEKMLQFPAVSLLRFFKNHGLLGTKTHHQWWTVTGGSREYVRRLIVKLNNLPRLSSEVVEVRRGVSRATVTTIDGASREYDQVVLACHADDALNLIREPLAREIELLSRFSYQRNDTTVHTDHSVMPDQKRCWASWNYRVDGAGSTTHYWMNSLQDVSNKHDFFVSLNGDHLIDPRRVLMRMVYHHPVFSLEAIEAQSQLRQLNESSHRDQLFFCGSYFGYGFHEDAFSSACRLAELLTGRVHVAKVLPV